MNKDKLAAILGMLAAEGIHVTGGRSRTSKQTKCIRCGESKPDNRAFCSARCCKLWQSGNRKPCETCGDTGRTLVMVCYGDSPYEREQECPDCNMEDEG